MMQNSGMNTCWLIGHPVAHSLSPGMQRVLYRDMGIEGWAYRKKDLKEIYQIKEFISGVIKKKDIGFNVTVPHKENIIKLIDKTDEAALAIGAVNTVKNSRGILKGYNTDWVGFKNDLKESIGIKKCRDALVLGAGGAGRSVVYALAGGIADGDIYLYDKDIARAGRLKKDLSNNNAVSVVGSLSTAMDMISGVELLVNATPVGMKPGPPVIDLKSARSSLKVYDVVYNRKTELIGTAKTMGLKASSGAGMLAGQGAEAFYIWSEGKYGKVPAETKEKMKKYIIKEVNND